MKPLRSLIVVSLVAATGACAPDVRLGLDTPGYGDAVRANIAAQTVNPMAPSDRAPLAANGERAALQQKLYLSDMVEAPEEVGTLQGVAGGGGGGGGAGAGGAGAGVGAATQ